MLIDACQYQFKDKEVNNNLRGIMMQALFLLNCCMFAYYLSRITSPVETRNTEIRSSFLLTLLNIIHILIAKTIFLILK